MSDGGMSDAEFDAKVGFPVGERYVPKSKLDAAEARALAAEANERARIVAWLRASEAKAEPSHRDRWWVLKCIADAIERNERGAGK